MPHFKFLTQVYPPDSAAVGQYFEDAAVRLAKRGHDVTVYTSDRDYDNPAIKYDGGSQHPGVRVVRLRWTSFGKRTILHRLLGQGLYLIQSFFCLLFARRVDGVVLTTIPATTGIMYLLLSFFRRLPTLYWVMDVNPDQAVALGTFSDSSLLVRILNWANRHLLEGVDKIVVLDEYMADRICRKLGGLSSNSGKLVVIPPWPLSDHIQPIRKDENSFVEEHGLTKEHFVFMYSGNHSLVHPLDTLLAGIRAHKERTELAFLFVGGGRGKVAVECFISTECTKNVTSLPYQSLSGLSQSLSAADVHIVVMGPKMVGIVHPCKIYGAMAVGKPVLYIGPKKSHLGELVSQHEFGWVIEHGNAKELSQLIAKIALLPQTDLQAIGRKGQALIEGDYSTEVLAEKFCDLIEQLYNP